MLRPIRQSIYFESVEDLLQCLEAIAADPEVRIVRLNNRLDPDYDSAQTAGYRDVSINLLLSSPEARRLCLDWHVCELQLVLIDFARIKVRT